MTEQQNTTTEATTEANVAHHATRKGADMSLARKEISSDSHNAVLAGELSLEEARFLGRNAGPSGPTVRVDKNDRPPTKTPCLCGCGEFVARSFKAGHDMRMHRIAREHLTEGRKLSKEQRDYLETSGKLERTKRKVSEEKRRKTEREAKKSKK